MNWKSFLFCSIFLTIALTAFSQKGIPPKPNPPRLVNDYASMLSPGEVAALERKLVGYEDSTSIQIAIVIVSSLDGEDAFTYSLEIAESWGIGYEGDDNGLLIFIAQQDRKFGIQTGYGTEGFLPDATANRIIRTVVVPHFRDGAYYQGLNRATDIIMDLGQGEYEGREDGGTRRKASGTPVILILAFLILFVLVVAAFNRGSDDDDDDDGGYYHGGRYDMDDHRRRRRRRRGGGWIIFPGFGGFGGGGGGGGGGGLGGLGGGGFGGFGGGGFGGGGAWGEW